MKTIGGTNGARSHEVDLHRITVPAAASQPWVARGLRGRPNTRFHPVPLAHLAFCPDKHYANYPPQEDRGFA